MPLRRPLRRRRRRRRRLAVVHLRHHRRHHQRIATPTRYSVSKQAGHPQNGIGAAHSAWGVIVP